MRNNELRNIILYIEKLKRQLKDLKIENEDINLTICSIVERITCLIENEIEESNYYLSNLKNNVELLEILKKDN